MQLQFVEQNMKAPLTILIICANSWGLVSSTGAIVAVKRRKNNQLVGIQTLFSHSVTKIALI
jgi:hypothetical protein